LCDGFVGRFQNPGSRIPSNGGGIGQAVPGYVLAFGHLFVVFLSLELRNVNPHTGGFPPLRNRRAGGKDSLRSVFRLFRPPVAPLRRRRKGK
jgi:hypothetical protein